MLVMSLHITYNTLSFKIRPEFKIKLNVTISRFSILALVLINSILIGINTHAETVAKYRPFLQTVEQLILGIFVFEILLKWMYDFRMFWTVRLHNTRITDSIIHVPLHSSGFLNPNNKPITFRYSGIF